MIVIYKGARGRGKTLTMCRDAKKFTENGWKVYSNMQGLKIGEYITNEKILAIDKNEEVLFNCVLVIDEIQTLFDSRTSMKKENRDFSYFLQQIRKRGIVMLTTTQFTNTIDLRLRQHIDVIVIPRFIKKYNVCEVKYIDLRTIEDAEFGVTEPECVTIVYDAEKIFGIYDTREMIV